MLVDGQRYAVMMSQTLYRWLMFRALRPILDSGPDGWTHAGRVTYGRLETLYAHGRQVEISWGGRILRLTKKDARTLMGIIELARGPVLPDPPGSSRWLFRQLSWQVGDMDRVPGEVPEQVRTLRLIPIGNGQYLTQGGGTMSAPGVRR